MSKQHGGKREGAGRPKLPASERLIPVTVRLTQKQLEFCRGEIGEREVSKYIRRLITAEIADAIEYNSRL